MAAKIIKRNAIHPRGRSDFSIAVLIIAQRSRRNRSASDDRISGNPHGDPYPMDLVSLLTETHPALNDLAILVMRLFIGICFIVHGLGKLGVVGTGDMAGFAGWLESLNVPFAPIQARIAMISEIAGGSALALGLLTRPACFLLIATMIVAARLGHKNAGYLITNEPPGAEYTVNLAAICFVIALLGPGLYSLDRLIF
jgi:putative oxidoreductase